MNNNTLTIIVILLVVLIGGYLLMNRTPATTTETADITAEDSDVTNEDIDVVEENSEVAEMMASETVALSPVEGVAEAQTGTAVFEETEDGVRVTVNVSGYTTDVPQPAHIHVGECPDVGDVKYPIENLMNGASTTVIQGVTLDQLRGEYPLALNVHKSAEEVNVYTSCGNLEF